MIEQKLTPKQQKFADYYIETGNATESAIRAGYSKKTAKEMGSENLTKPHISSYIAKHMEKLQSERIANQEEILATLTAIMRGQKRGTALVGVGMGEQEVTQVEPTLGEKIKAAELLGKRYAMWTDKQQVDAVVTPQFIDDISGDEG